MEVLIDTNVILNFITGREDPFRVSSEKVMDYAVENCFHGYIAIHTLPTLWYVLRKVRTEDETRLLLEKICNILTIAAISPEDMRRAISNKAFKDYEDCLQDECAQSIGADYLVTCNYKHFKNAKTTVVTPDEFLKILGQIQGNK